MLRSLGRINGIIAVQASVPSQAPPTGWWLISIGSDRFLRIPILDGPAALPSNPMSSHSSPVLGKQLLRSPPQFVAEGYCGAHACCCEGFLMRLSSNRSLGDCREVSDRGKYIPAVAE
jgi:hypothetical protein